MKNKSHRLGDLVKTNLGLFVALSLTLFVLWRNVPDDDTAWILFVFVIFPVMAANLMVIILGLIWQKQQTPISKLFIAIGALFFLRFIVPIDLPILAP